MQIHHAFAIVILLGVCCAVGGRALPSNSTPVCLSRATPAGSMEQRTITADDNRTEIHVRVNDRLLINLGGGWDWTLDPFDETIITLATGGQALPKGAQAMLEAKKPGTVVISLSGEAPCAKASPPCAVQTRRFRVTVVVVQ